MTARYLLDRSSSRFTVQAFAGGLFSSLGHNPTFAIRDFSGEASFDPAAPGVGFITLRVRADSLELTDEVSAKDRGEIESTMKEKVLETGRYAEILYRSSSLSAEGVGPGSYSIRLGGELSLHGVTKPLPVTAKVTETGDLLRAAGACALLQSDYGIKPVKVAGGALKVKDELKFAFDIVARKE